MRFSVMVLSDPRTSRASNLALRALESAHLLGHSLDSAFFYHKAAYIAVNPNQRADYARWCDLVSRSDLRCLVCRAAASREKLELGECTPWVMAGLADWLAAVERSDRVLTFGSYSE